MTRMQDALLTRSSRIEPPTPFATSSPQPLRVLLVEDSPDDAELVVLALRQGGYQVTHERVETEPTMRAALMQRRWDIVLSDYAMPSFSAPDALAVLEAVGLDIPFIIVSGTVGEETAVAAIRSGANDYVLKGHLARLCPAIDRELRDTEMRAERRRMQEQLLIADRMASVGTLAAGVAHEINNPLAAIIANLELMSMDLTVVARELNATMRLREVFEELNDARECADNLRHIISDLKIFSRSTDEEQRGPVNVTRVLDSSLRMAWNEIRHRARLVKDYGSVPPVDANESRLGQVFLNLIVNAAHAIAEGDTEHNVIRVVTSVDAASDRVVVEVRDTGVGIPPENLTRIFDPVFTTKPIGVGTGLGLSICHRIVSGFGGEIQVQSQPGTGTVFRVLLPPSPGRAPTTYVQPEAARASRRGRLLVIDDEPTVGRVIERALSVEHDVTVSGGAHEALKLLTAGEHFDLILCDLMMPQMTGMELHAELSATAPEIVERMVFLTGGAFTPGARSFMDTVANQHIDKPFDTKHLRALVNERLKG